MCIRDIFMGTAGNAFCQKMFEHYQNRQFKNPEGSVNDTISPYTMSAVAKSFGWQMKDEKQVMPGLTVILRILLLPTIIIRWIARR